MCSNLVEKCQSCSKGTTWWCSCWSRLDFTTNKKGYVNTMDELVKMDTQKLLKHCMLKFRHIGGFQEEIQIDPEKKRNMKRREVPIEKYCLELDGDIEKLTRQYRKPRVDLLGVQRWIQMNDKETEKRS